MRRGLKRFVPLDSCNRDEELIHRVELEVPRYVITTYF